MASFASFGCSGGITSRGVASIGVGWLSVLALSATGCGEGEIQSSGATAGAGPGGAASGIGGSVGAGVGGSGTAGSGTGGNGTSGAGVGGSGAGGTGVGGAGVGGGGPATCEQAAGAYTILTLPLDPGLPAPQEAGGFGSSRNTLLPVVGAADGRLLVGFTSGDAAIVADTTGQVFSVPGSRLGGFTATSDGLGLLLFDPASESMWAQVARYSLDGQQVFATDLFRSANLEDEGTKGEAGTGRLGYLSASDELVAYFGHTQRYDDGVRHQGGYLARISASGEQTLVSGWWGSHNLDQRLFADGADAAMLGLGDAYPIGLFFAMLSERPSQNVVYRYAAAGNGTANGQLGGIVDIDSELIVPFITNLSVSPDIDAGEWPDIDPDVSDQIGEAAANGTDMGLLRLPKSNDLPDGDAPTAWLSPELTAGARLQSLKSARYGTGDLTLLIWAEATGGNRDNSANYFSMVVDPSGAVCLPKTPLDAAHAVTGGDDILRVSDGRVVWANQANGGISLVVLTPP